MPKQMNPDSEVCPECGTSLLGPEIPFELRDLYYGGKARYSRVISVYDRDVDRTVALQCPDCYYKTDT